MQLLIGADRIQQSPLLFQFLFQCICLSVCLLNSALHFSDPFHGCIHIHVSHCRCFASIKRSDLCCSSCCFPVRVQLCVGCDVVLMLQFAHRIFQLYLIPAKILPGYCVELILWPDHTDKFHFFNQFCRTFLYARYSLIFSAGKPYLTHSIAVMILCTSCSFLYK